MSPTFLASIRDTAIAAWRNLSRHRLHGLGVAFLLALGLGSVLAVSALVDRLMIHPAPYPEAARVVMVYGVEPEFDRCQFNPTSFHQLALGTSLFEALAACDAKPLVLGEEGGAAPVRGARVTSAFFQVLGVRPLLGRLAFTAEEDRWGGPGAVVVTEGAWRSRHGADPGLVGSTLLLDGLPRTVVGILPRGVTPPTHRISGAQYYVPAAFSPVEQAEKGNGWDVVGRLQRGAGLAQAAAALEAFAAARAVSGRTGFRAAPVATELGRRWKDTLPLFGAAAMLLLLLAGINSAALVLARTEGRRAELAVRSALGAGGSRLAGLLFMEGLFTGLGGFLLGIPVAWVIRTALVRHLGLDFVPPFGAPAYLGGALGMLTVLGLSLAVPAWAVVRTDPAGVLKQQGRNVVKAGRHWVLTGELALASMLLVGSCLLLRSLVNLTRLPTGFQAPEQVLAGTITLPAGAFPNPEARSAAFAALQARLAALPGVTRAALTQTAPLYKAPGCGSTRTAAGQEVEFYRHWGAGDVPGALGLGLKAGRMPGPGEAACALSDTLAAALWPGGEALGRTCPIGSWRVPVVGILGAAAENDPRNGLDRQIWIPLNPDLSFVDVFLRGASSQAALVPALRRAVREAAPGAQVLKTLPLSEVVDGVNEVPRKAAWLLGCLSLLALFLAGAGVYGVTAQWVLQRRRELGIRLALGETPGGLLRLVLGQASRLALLGLGFGLLGSAWTGLALRHLLHGVGLLDPLSCAGGLATLAVGVLLAGLGPALGAARTHPTEALRGES